jgi:hypothetical protein
MTALEPIRANDLATVEDQCAGIEVWAEQCDSVPEIQAATTKLAMIDEYLARTSTDGRARVKAAMRRLEVRIGQLLGPAKPGPQSESSLASEDLSANERMAFRAMAANPDVVEDVIAQSTDENPASRRQVTAAIAEAKAEAKPDTDLSPAKPSTPRRRPWADAYSDAISAVEKATTTLQHLAQDSRATKHSEQAVGRTNDLLRAIDALAGVADQLR